MDNVDLSVLSTLQINPDLLDDLNYLASILEVDVDVLINDSIKLYLSAMRICSHRFVGSSDDINVEVYGDQNL